MAVDNSVGMFNSFGDDGTETNGVAADLGGVRKIGDASTKIEEITEKLAFI
ncbi:hypothetical protein AGMMS50222_06320 [Endomicrobiia bacterium]|nr:hypothetical protein AGMMS49531_11270 [Endomicrobiia bacterium]GHT75413.1 hypothetical protein AGMMS50222_06320 [Endomicrobiia bacterium]